MKLKILILLLCQVILSKKADEDPEVPKAALTNPPVRTNLPNANVKTFSLPENLSDAN